MSDQGVNLSQDTRPRWNRAMLDSFGGAVTGQYEAGDEVPSELSDQTVREGTMNPNIYNNNIYNYRFSKRDSKQ